LAEKVGVGAGSGEQHLRVGRLVDQEPVGLDVALTKAAPLALEGVITAGSRQSLALGKLIQEGIEECEVVAALGNPLVVPLVAGRSDERPS
jgi:hypothetical protein